MKLKSLILERFGPFAKYQLDFPTDDRACILLVGKNNAGKSSIIRALKLIDSAMKFAKQSPEPVFGLLPKKDIEDIEIDRLIHNYETGGIAVVTGVLDTNREISVYLDSSENTVSFELPARAHRSMAKLFGFIPQLGQLAERETFISRNHVLHSLNTTLAPRHLRNHIYQLISKEEQQFLRNIINDSWEGIELQDVQLDTSTDILYCLYKENSILHEIAWAGQGLQIWIQIMTHIVRLSSTSTLVLDEPEIFLHPEKQHDLIQALREYYNGTVIIATHSSELMNDVDISHIIHVQKDAHRTKMLQISERDALEKIRDNIGSSFNLIASQFEDVELLIATEYELDYNIVHQLALAYGIKAKTQNVRISGFNNWKDSLHYKQAYSMFFGKQVKCSLLLDRDYYPQNYLDTIKDELTLHKIKVVFTPGKEIENLFLEEDLLKALVPHGDDKELQNFLDDIYRSEYDDCFSKYVDFHNQFSPGRKGKAYHTTYRDLKPTFDANWSDKKKRHNLIPGKRTLSKLRVFFKDQYKMIIPTSVLTKDLVETGNCDARSLISALFD
jgi:energy-coupling factor transporter ATP-binding protein EcfA2